MFTGKLYIFEKVCKARMLDFLNHSMVSMVSREWEGMGSFYIAWFCVVMCVVLNMYFGVGLKIGVLCGVIKCIIYAIKNIRRYCYHDVNHEQ